MEDRVRATFERFTAEGPEAIREFLAPDVEMLSPQPGPWDCHGREAVLRFLYGYQAGGQVAKVIEVTEYGDRLLLGLRRTHSEGASSDHYSVLTVRDDCLRRMQGYASRPAALVAIYGMTVQGLDVVPTDVVDR